YILLRTAQAVGVPGEVKKSVYFSEGQEVTITGTIAAVRREVLCFNKCGHFDKGIYSPLK
ncbi:hypothetical protein, partial [Raoultella planticola]|uniref:hypothetical protein n=1 Tax=Raoultella planticola TaxID=575 RepID=UPI0034E57628